MKRTILLLSLSLALLLALLLAATVSADSGYPTYVVKPGDNLYRIAVSHRVSLQALIRANHLRAPYIIRPGQVLYIPDPNAPIWLNTPYNGQVVSSPIHITGNSTTFEGVVIVRIRDRTGRVIAQGMTIGGSMGTLAPFAIDLAYQVPYSQWGSVEALEESAATGADMYTVGSRVYLTGGAPRYYVVKRGDNLTRIARRFGTTWQAIATANRLRNPNLIYPGQRLLIP